MSAAGARAPPYSTYAPHHTASHRIASHRTRGYMRFHLIGAYLINGIVTELCQVCVVIVLQN